MQAEIVATGDGYVIDLDQGTYPLEELELHIDNIWFEDHPRLWAEPAGPGKWRVIRRLDGYYATIEDAEAVLAPPDMILPGGERLRGVPARDIVKTIPLPARKRKIQPAGEYGSPNFRCCGKAPQKGEYCD